MPYDAPPDLADLSLSQIADALAARRLPPVEQWSPATTLDSEMTIRADGTWLHRGSPISRPAMVRAFASLLMRKGDSYWLMTPHVRHAIAVEDAAFIAVDVQPRGVSLAFRLNTDEFVIADAEHRLRAAGDPETPAIYLGVRHGCEARVNRSTWLQLVDLARCDLAGGSPPAVTSSGETFALVPSA